MGMYSAGMGMGMGVQQQQPLQQTEEFVFDDSAFERAFADMEREVNGVEEGFAGFEQEEELVAVEGKAKEEVGADNEDLARTAGKLLDSVQGDASEKFRNSNFLALMRRLRDREVVVEGDRMVEREGRE